MTAALSAADLDVPSHAMPRSLAELVDACHGYAYPAGPAVHRGLPGTSLTLVLSFAQPLDVSWATVPASRDRFGAIVSGLAAMPALIRQSGPQLGIQLELTPRGARALLGTPAGALAGQLVHLSDVIGARAADRLYDDVAGQSTWPGRYTALDAGLTRLAGRCALPAVPDAVAYAWERLTSAEPTAVHEVAAEIGWSRRHLGGRFSSEYGIAPKVTARLARFARSVDPVRRPGTRSLADVAADCGYADQSHLSRDWQALAGTSPTGWRLAESMVS